MCQLFWIWGFKLILMGFISFLTLRSKRVVSVAASGTMYSYIATLVINGPTGLTFACCGVKVLIVFF